MKKTINVIQKFKDSISARRTSLQNSKIEFRINLNPIFESLNFESLNL